MKIVLAEHFTRDPVSVAPTLLGLVVRHGGVAIRISEVEAYHGSADPGSHGFRGRTERNSALFGPPGTVYAYINYGIHRALNIVCGPDGEAGGCLVRSGEVIEGPDTARQRRGPAALTQPARKLASGPGNLAKALGIDLHVNGVPVYDPSSPVTLWEPTDGPREVSVSTGPRVGVSGPGGDGEAYPWRFWCSGDPTVSAYRPATKRRRSRNGTAEPK